MVELNQNRQMVSTHSRPKAAGLQAMISTFAKFGFNTQPPEGGWEIFRFHLSFSNVSTHSRPKAAGTTSRKRMISPKFQHTAARRRLEANCRSFQGVKMFQHTAARRRLGHTFEIRFTVFGVSTHSRPKAAG